MINFILSQVANDRKSSSQAAALAILKKLVDIRPEIAETLELHAAASKAIKSGDFQKAAEITAQASQLAVTEESSKPAEESSASMMSPITSAEPSAEPTPIDTATDNASKDVSMTESDTVGVATSSDRRDSKESLETNLLSQGDADAAPDATFHSPRNGDEPEQTDSPPEAD